MNKRDLLRAYRRMLVLVLVLIPVFLGINILLGDNVSNVTKIAFSVLIGGVIVALVEFIRYNIRKNK